MNLLARWFGAEPFNDASVVIAPGFWLVWAVVIASAAAVVLAWMSTSRLVSIKRRIAPFIPRLLAILFIGGVALQPELELRRSTRLRNTVAVIADSSASMGIRWREDQDSRSEATAKFFRRNRAYFADLERAMDVRYFSLAADATPTDREAIEKGLPATGKRSNIIGGVRDVAASLQDSRLKAILLFTDGVDTEEGRPEYLRNTIAAPVHVFFPREEGFKDVEIAEVRRDEFAFIRTPWKATAIVRVRGYRGKKIPLTLKQGDSIVMSKTIETNPGDENYPVDIQLTPNQTGKFFYTLSAPRYSDEAVRQNNEFTFGLNVVRDKIRILHVCGMPSWDCLFLRRAMKLDPNIDLVSLFILRTPSDLNIVPSAEMSLIPFPVNAFLQDDLHSFDLVVFQNFAYGPYGVGPFLPYIRDYVKRERGAFVMIGGDQSFAEGRYVATPIEEILPVEVPAPGDTLDAAAFRAGLTEEGKRHPITTLEPDDERNRQVWAQLPKLDGCNKLGEVKRDALVLVENPLSGRPVVVVGETGNGRTMAVTADTLWHWNFLSVGAGRGNRHYLSFWKNAIRWLIRDPSFDLVKLSTERDTCVVGEGINIIANVFDHTYQAVPGAKLSYKLFKAGRADPLKSGDATADNRGRWNYEHPGSEPGLFRLKVHAQEGDRELGEAEISFLIRADDTEYFSPAVATDFIADVADATGGKYFDLSGDRFRKELTIDNPKVIQLLDRKNYPLWNNWIILAVVLLLLSLEWTVRRRMGLS